MGGDGGSIPKRVEMVKLKKKAEKLERRVALAAKWKHCAITQEPLRKPIVACELGRLYNKDKVIEWLLDKSKFDDPTRLEHIRGLKDIRELQLTDNPAFKDENMKGGEYEMVDQFICPITGMEMTGTYKFQFLWKCGCAFAEKAIKEVKMTTCHKCAADVKDNDYVTINPEEEEEKRLKEAMEERRAQAKLAKKNKKKKAASSATNDDGPSTSKQPKLDNEKSTSDNKHSNGSAEKHNGLSGKLANGVKKDKTKLANGAKDNDPSGKTEQKKYKSIQDDPKHSSTYKNLFSTGKDAMSKPKANWVTHNPFYN